VAKWPTYGKLSRRKIDDLEEGARAEAAGDKRDPRDFAVWRAAPLNHLMQWNSPWGAGFPGWHAECTVMARKYLGLPFDIHGGGLENIFPHNESEIAQSEAAYGNGFARYWLLNNMVTIDGAKMGKSMGNSLNIQQAITGSHARLSQPCPPLALRFFILSSHYRQNTDFTDKALQSAVKGHQRLLNTAGQVRQKLAGATGAQIDAEFAAVIKKHRARFIDAMNNDFNTPQALAALFDFNRAVNGLINAKASVPAATLKAIDAAYRALGGEILGIIPDEISGSGNNAAAGLEEELIRLLVNLRTAARKNRDFATSDAIRKQLSAIGVILQDGPAGTTWKVSA